MSPGTQEDPIKVEEFVPECAFDKKVFPVKDRANVDSDSLIYVKAVLRGLVCYVGCALEEDLKGFPHRDNRNGMLHNREFLTALFDLADEKVGSEDIPGYEELKQGVGHRVQLITESSPNLENTLKKDWLSIQELIDQIAQQLIVRGFEVPEFAVTALKGRMQEVSPESQ